MGITGIAYASASGSLNNIEVRNQNPGGCGFGVFLNGDFGGAVNMQNSNIHDFDNTGVVAGSNGATQFLVNFIANGVTSTSTGVQAGVRYFSAEGLVKRNIIAVGGQAGLLLENIYCCVTTTENIVVGSNVGIYLGGSPLPTKNIVTHNLLFNNGTGIFVYGDRLAPVLNSNEIVQSSSAAIDLGCDPYSTAEHNTIFDAPLGIANIASGDTVKLNTFYDVTTLTSTCP